MIKGSLTRRGIDLGAQILLGMHVSVQDKVRVSILKYLVNVRTQEYMSLWGRECAFLDDVC